jgi:hypothetical protein
VLRDVLAALATDPGFGGRDAALVLLAASGGADHPGVAAALSSGDAGARVRVLDALAAAETLPQGLRRQLAQVFERAPDWPTRLRVARLLGDGLGKERLSREPVALVRAAALPVPGPAAPPPHAAPACSGRAIN